MSNDDLLQQAVKLHLGGDLPGAAQLYRRILTAHPRHPDALHLLGLAELQSGRPGAALPLIKKAIGAAPKSAPFRGNLGTVLLQLGHPSEARKAYEQSVAIDPSYADGWRNLGSLCSRLEDHEASARAYEALVTLTQGKDGTALGYLGLSRAVLCQWDEVARMRDAILASPDWKQSGGLPVPPFTLVFHDLSPEQLKLFADRAASHIKQRVLPTSEQKPMDHARRPRRERLRVGYLSEDFHEHATAYLIAEMLESHDRTRFEIFAYSYGPDDKSAMHKRITAAVDHRVEIGPLPIHLCAKRIFDDGIDILVDLKGHTGMARTEILPLRPAPVMVEYLGFPGTFGGDYIDYIIADGFVIPPDGEAAYSEQIVRLPYSYQVNDRKRPRPESRPKKSAYGLPEDAFVFCSFNNSFKITAQIFDVWMDLLAAHPNSVLWLLDFHKKASATLREHAVARGIAPDRLIFAPRMKLADHMARIAAADLFLDTFPCGAHTTASDALWAGLPLVTMAGPTFASRVAGSLLHGLGFPELVTSDLDSYRTLASRLAGQPEELASLRARLEKNVPDAKVFDGNRFARDIEKTFDRMWDKFSSGLSPQGFSL